MILESKSQNKQVLLCGTGYGACYLPAIFDLPNFELTAILARGSDKSVKLAEQSGVALHHTLDTLDETVDLACVAIGGAIGTDIASQLLQRKTPVLIEHPVTIADIHKLLNQANEHRVPLHIHSHFPELPPIQRFITQCHQLNQLNTPELIQLTCNSRTLFSLLDILMRCFGSFDCDLLNLHSTDGYKSVSAILQSNKLKPTPCHLSYQSWRYSQDNSMDSPLGHQITLVYPNGVLSLNGTFGPCTWHPLLAGGFNVNTAISSCHPELIGCNIKTMIAWRKSALQKSILALTTRNLDTYNSNEYAIHLCSMWSHLFSQLGYEERPLPRSQPIDPVFTI